MLRLLFKNFKPRYLLCIEFFKSSSMILIPLSATTFDLATSTADGIPTQSF